MKLENELLRNIGSLCRCVQSVMDLKFRHYNLQRGQFIFLTRTCENPGIRQVELTSICNVDKGTTAKAVSKLEAAGYLIRKQDAGDGRAWNLFPTESGKKLYEALIQEENRELSLNLQGFTEKEIDEVLRLVAKLQNNMQDHWRACR